MTQILANVPDTTDFDNAKKALTCTYTLQQQRHAPNCQVKSVAPSRTSSGREEPAVNLGQAERLRRRWDGGPHRVQLSTILVTWLKI